MSLLRMVEERLPPGFRFHPRDEELVSDYLAAKATDGGGGSFPMMVDVDLNKCEPWDLPDSARIGSNEWYFYSQRDRKYATGQRTNRATAAGYWKATGKDRSVVDLRRGGLVGMRKTLVFYQGRAPGAPRPTGSCTSSEDWVLCRVLYKSRGPPSKPSTSEACYDDTGSSLLPPLMDAFTSLDPEGYGHMAFFSSQHHQRQQNSPAVSHISVAAAVLEQLAKLDGGVKAELFQNPTEGSSESYLTESGNQCIWDHHPF
ncbi:unnamed protein product [Spirodela intermedia]|uniref:NAC domain-containing protein n=1 Tax=Spirodela intermedia TaxID=51605 RepID=A0A7I8JEL1_SPIIN|nr:unnamed protein product [Spirodela intermedia]CAA6668559.1 unnamed protein product [Spirodela intermedia]